MFGCPVCKTTLTYRLNGHQVCYCCAGPLTEFNPEPLAPAETTSEVIVPDQTLIIDEPFDKATDHSGTGARAYLSVLQQWNKLSPKGNPQ